MADRLSVTGIAKRFGATIALDGVDFAIAAGEVHALIGENGAGKSTLLGVLHGGTRADRGMMQLDDSRYAPNTPHEARRRGVVLIHQELSLCAHLSVMENVLLGAELSRAGVIDRRASHRRAEELLSELPHPEIQPDALVRDLSLPARQIVEVCRALASEARVVLMDEPTSSLQGSDVERLFALIRRLASKGMSIVYVSHFLEEVRRIADRYTVLRDGRSVATGMMDAVTNDDLIATMVGRPPATLFPAGVRYAIPQVAMCVEGLACPPRLHDATFELRRGEIFGIAGLLGSGRTELVRALIGLDAPSAGMVRVGDNDEPSTSASRRIREGVGYLSEDRKGEGLALALSLADNICATRPEYAHSALGILDLQEQSAQSSRWMSVLRVSALGTQQAARSLSGGNQQKVALARLLHQRANILLLDEPTRGIDIGAKADVYEMINLRASAGCAVLIVSSYLPELFGLCDRLAVMCRGTLSPARAIDEWTPESVMTAAIGG
ncbi:MAG: transporter related protein [Gemmatimonadetes bacterium]|nr:transporter related protein [Gemmatimonadota bacterium]